jgi:hypothetical protein
MKITGQPGKRTSRDIPRQSYSSRTNRARSCAHARKAIVASRQSSGVTAWSSRRRTFWSDASGWIWLRVRTYLEASSMVRITRSGTLSRRNAGNKRKDGFFGIKAHLFVRCDLAFRFNEWCLRLFVGICSHQMACIENRFAICATNIEIWVVFEQALGERNLPVAFWTWYADARSGHLTNRRRNTKRYGYCSAPRRAVPVGIWSRICKDAGMG